MQKSQNASACWGHMCRRWVFLPSLVCTVPLLVMVEGGDALQICLNTVAILFLCDIGETPPPVSAEPQLAGCCKPPTAPGLVLRSSSC